MFNPNVARKICENSLKIWPIAIVCTPVSGVAMAFPGGRLTHPEDQNQEENEESLRKNKKIWSNFGEKMRKVELLPTWDCEAGYGPDLTPALWAWKNILWSYDNFNLTVFYLVWKPLKWLLGLWYEFQLQSDHILKKPIFLSRFKICEYFHMLICQVAKPTGTINSVWYSTWERR